MNIELIKLLKGPDLVNFLWSHKYLPEFLEASGCFYKLRAKEEMFYAKLDIGDGVKCTLKWGVDDGYITGDRATFPLENLLNINEIGRAWQIKRLEQIKASYQKELDEINNELSKLYEDKER